MILNSFLLRAFESDHFVSCNYGEKLTSSRKIVKLSSIFAPGVVFGIKFECFLLFLGK